jgi:hypothetical protein
LSHVDSEDFCKVRGGLHRPHLFQGCHKRLAFPAPT